MEEGTKPRVKGGMTRRQLCFGLGGVAAAFGLGTLKFAPERQIVRPPGGGDTDRLLANCVRCDRCLEACPHDAIKPAHLEDGVLTVRTPQMDFSSSYCDFCTEENGGKPLCAAACATGALLIADDVPAEDVPLGIARITTDWCLAYHMIGCRFCYDACPYEAIQLDDTNRPVVDESKCNGCGACESVCVSLTEGSISVGATSRAITVQPIQEG